MNKGLNIFLVVFLCVISYVGLLLSFYSSDDSETWNPKMGYAMPTGRTYGISAVSVDASSTGSDVAAISVRSANSMFHHRPSFSFAPAASMSAYSMGGSSSILPFGEGVGAQGASPIYATSSAEFHSFGGGGNTGGVSMSGGVVSSNSQSPIANTQLAVQGGGLSGITSSSPTSFNTSSFNSLISLSPNSLIASLPASNYQGITVMGDPRGIRGRKNLGINDDNVEDSWLNWLALMGINVGDVGHYDESTNTWYYDYYDLQKLYQEFCNNWNSGMGKKPTWDEWLAWFMGSEGNPYIWGEGDRQCGFSYVPVGDFMPLIVFALLYVVFMVCRCRMINMSEDVE